MPAQLTREKGFCEQMVENFEEYIMLEGSPDQLGAAQAILGPENDQTGNQIYPIQGPDGTVKEYRMRYHKDLTNATAFDNPATGVTYACSADNTAAADYSEEVINWESSAIAIEQWSTEPAQVEKFCRADYDGWRNTHLFRHLKRARRKLNQQLYALLKAGKGKIYVGPNADASIDSVTAGYADGDVFTFSELLGSNGEIRTNWMLDLLELLELNNMGQAIGVFGHGTLQRFLRMYRKESYCCNQSGVSLDRVADLIADVGFAPFQDSTIKDAPVSAGRSEAMFFKPGTAKFHQWNRHLGPGKEWELVYSNGTPKDVRTSFADPVLPGVMWDYYLTHNPCATGKQETGGVYNEGFYCRFNLWTKPTDVNSNELDTTNQIMELAFSQASRLNAAGGAEVAPLG